jgi:ribonuclease R
MEKAIYTHINVGHFSLGFENYTHFTSPIRRYPDIMVHRILASIINNEPLSREDYIKYQKLAEHSTAMEIEAVQAERDSVKRALSTFLSDRVGDLFTGTITGVTDFGIFVSDIRTGAEGLVHVTKLPGRDFYEFDKERYQLVGKYRKRVFKIGQRVRMKLVRTDTERNRIDWELIPHRYLA